VNCHRRATARECQLLKQTKHFLVINKNHCLSNQSAGIQHTTLTAEHVDAATSASSLFHHYYLSALHLPLGKRTVMHLVARENLPEPASQGKELILNEYITNPR
jgi:hypothetical protein